MTDKWRANPANAKIVITELGISPTLLLGSLPVTVTAETNGHKTGQPAGG